MSLIDIKDFSLFSFGSDPRLIKLLKILLKENRELHKKLKEKDRINFEDKLKIKELEEKLRK